MAMAQAVIIKVLLEHHNTLPHHTNTHTDQRLRTQIVIAMLPLLHTTLRRMVMDTREEATKEKVMENAKELEKMQ